MPLHVFVKKIMDWLRRYDLFSLDYAETFLMNSPEPDQVDQQNEDKNMHQKLLPAVLAFQAESHLYPGKAGLISLTVHWYTVAEACDDLTHLAEFHENDQLLLSQYDPDLNDEIYRIASTRVYLFCLFSLERHD
jgi:hypothetical protein